MRAKILTFKRARRLRREMNLPEVILWDCLRQATLSGLRFRRQHPLGPYILDLYCATARLAVEFDGEGHAHPAKAGHHRARDRWLVSKGVMVLRFAASAVLNKEALPAVLGQIEPPPPPPPLRGPPPPRRSGGGPFRADLRGGDG